MEMPFLAVMQPSRQVISILLLAVLILSLSRHADGHTLPISFLALRADADYLHAELTLNPAELSIFAELDTNKDGRLEAGELTAKEQPLSDKIAGLLLFTAHGKQLKPEIAGISAAEDGHHLTFRAHYRGDLRAAPLQLESRLYDLTSGSHITLVNFAGAAEEYARIDSQSRKASFNGPVTASAAVQTATPRTSLARPGRDSTSPSVILLLLSIPGMAAGVGLFVLLRKTMKV